MTDEVINMLSPKIKYITTIKNASVDETNQQYMTESGLRVIDFDKIPKHYAEGRGWSGVPKSNDVLYIDKESKWYFIEFKNGNIEYEDVYRKIYDSLIMLIDWGIIPDFEFCRKNINYILVYNGEKYGKIQPSGSRDAAYGYISKLANEEIRRFHIDKLQQYLFNETHTYDKKMFHEKFILEKEKEEEND